MDSRGLLQRPFNIIIMKLACNGEVGTKHFPDFISDGG